MSRRGALVYLLVALLLAGAYFLATRQEERKAARESIARRVFDIQKAAVTGLDLRRGEEPEVRIERGGAAEGAPEGRPAWRIVAPRQLPADSQAVDGVLEAALTAEKRRTLEGTALDPAEYGLDHPSLSLTLRTGGASQAIELGAESITGDARYARLAGGKDIFLIPAATYNQMDLGLEGLRDRRLMPVARDAIERIGVAWDDARVALRKENGRWRFAKRERPVSETAVDGLIATLSETNVDRFVTDAEVAPEEYGLDKPDAMVTFEGGDRTWVARFKRTADDAAEPGVLASRSTAPGIVALPATFLDRLPRSADDLEDQILLRADTDGVAAITLTSGGKAARFEKEGDAWKQSDAPALLTLLADLRHDGAPPRGTAMAGDPELSILLARADGEPVLDLRIGAAMEGDGARAGRLKDDAGERDILLSRFTFENLQDGIRALAPDLLPSPAPSDADGASDAGSTPDADAP